MQREVWGCSRVVNSTREQKEEEKNKRKEDRTNE